MPDPNSQAPNPASESTETPEDVATLYSWANLHGAKYRDFSAARAQAREAAKQRAEEAAAAERLRQEEEAERLRQEEAQRAAREAAQAAEEARLAEAERLAELAHQAEVERQAVLAAQEAQRQAVQQRGWQSQAAAPVAATSQPSVPPAQIPSAQLPPARPTAYSVPAPAERPAQSLAPSARVIEAASREATAYPSVAPAPFISYPEPQSFFSAPAVEELPPSWLGSIAEPEAEPPVRSSWLAPEIPAVIPEAPQQRAVPIYAQPVATPPPVLPQPPQPSPAPAALPAVSPAAPPALAPYVAAENPQRDPGNRWFALKNVFDPHADPIEQPLQQQPTQAPVLAVFSLAGGVGKTSLIASLGRALSARGERILLVDTTAFGLLPFFFGARDQRPGQLRTFTPPGTSLEAPIQLITLDPESPLTESLNDSSLTSGASERPQEWLSAEITRLGRGHHRVLIDLPSASGAITRRILRLNPTIVVPVAPDMNSVVSVSAIESFFRNNGVLPGSGKHVQPYYLLNQFDYSLPLHLDVRELLREQIGDRLLPFTLRRSPAVSEALAEGMTVMDYAPSTPLAEDVASLAGWVRSLAAPAVQTNRGVRWSER